MNQKNIYNKFGDDLGNIEAYKKRELDLMLKYKGCYVLDNKGDVRKMTRRCKEW